MYKAIFKELILSVYTWRSPTKGWNIKKRKVEPQILFSLKCFDRINPKKFSTLKYCVVWYEKAADTIYDSKTLCSVAATSNDLIIIATLGEVILIFKD